MSWMGGGWGDEFLCSWSVQEDEAGNLLINFVIIMVGSYIKNSIRHHTSFTHNAFTFIIYIESILP